MKLHEQTEIIGRLRYSTKTATLIASDCYWDGNNFERSGRNTWLFRTRKGAYFTAHQTMWQGEQDGLTVVSKEDAIDLYEGQLREHEVPYEEAFPDVKVEDA